MRKKGDTSVLQIIIFLVVILIAAIAILYFFGINITDVFRKLAPTRTNVAAVTQSCQLACSTADSSGFCCVQRDVIFQDGDKAVKLTCKDDPRLKGDCSIDCSKVLCGITESQFKAFCKSNCVNDNGKKETEFCCTQKTYVKVDVDVTTACKDVYSDAAKRADDLGITETTAKTKCDEVDCKKGANKDQEICPTA